MNKILCLLALSGFGFAAAQDAPQRPLSAQEKKILDAKAFAFTGKHCLRDYSLDVKPLKSKELSPAQSFSMQAKLVDAEFKYSSTKDKSVIYRSTVLLTSFQAQLSKQGAGNMFIGMYYKNKQAEMMSCFFKTVLG